MTVVLLIRMSRSLPIMYEVGHFEHVMGNQFAMTLVLAAISEELEMVAALSRMTSVWTIFCTYVCS